MQPRSLFRVRRLVIAAICILASLSTGATQTDVATRSASGLAMYNVPGDFGAGASASDSRTGLTFATARDYLAVIETATGIVTRTVPLRPGWGAVFVDEQRGRVVVCGRSGIAPPTIWILNAATGVLLHTTYLSGRGGFWSALLDTHNGRLVLTTDKVIASRPTHYVTLINDETGAVYGTAAVGHSVEQMALDAAHGRLLVLSDLHWPNRHDAGTERIIILDATNGTVVGTPRVVHVLQGPPPIVDQETGQAFVAVQNGLEVIDTRTGAVQATWPISASISLVDSRTRRLVGLSDTAISLYDLRSGRLVKTISTGVNNPVAADPLSGRLYLLAWNAQAPTLRVLDLRSGSVIDTLPLGPIGPAAMLVDGPADRLGIFTQTAFIDVDTIRDTIIGRTGVNCSVVGYISVPASLDTATGRLYCVSPGATSHDGLLLGTDGAGSVLDMVSGRPLLTFALASPLPDAAQVITETGYATIQQGNALSIIGPAHRTPANPVSSLCCHARYFTASHHNLGGPFLAFWRHYGGLDTFGSPQTEPFVENGRLMQYTDRFALELVHGTIRTVDVNQILVEKRVFERVPAVRATSTRRYFSSTGHTLSARFLAYWLTHHGDVVLGAPISEPIVEGNDDGSGRRYLLQWFEKGRLEYHPELAHTRYAVEVGLVGLQALQQRGWK